MCVHEVLSVRVKGVKRTLVITALVISARAARPARARKSCGTELDGGVNRVPCCPFRPERSGWQWSFANSGDWFHSTRHAAAGLFNARRPHGTNYPRDSQKTSRQREKGKRNPEIPIQQLGSAVPIHS